MNHRRVIQNKAVSWRGVSGCLFISLVLISPRAFAVSEVAPEDLAKVFGGLGGKDTADAGKEKDKGKETEKDGQSGDEKKSEEKGMDPLKAIVSMTGVLADPAGKGTEKTAAKLEILTFVDEGFVRKKPELVWGHDPFLKRPGQTNTVEEKVEELHLNAIITDRKNAVAMINGQIVKVGDTLTSGGKVTAIGSNYVLVKNGASLRELILPGVPDDPSRGPASGDSEDNGENTDESGRRGADTLQGDQLKNRVNQFTGQLLETSAGMKNAVKKVEKVSERLGSK